MSVEELVQAFEQSNKKANDIEKLANKFNISKREVIEVLKSFSIKNIPRIISRGEVVEFGDNIKETKTELKLDDDVTPAISIIKKFEEMGFAKKEGRERAIQLSYYIETKLGLDCFKIYCSMLEYIIKNSGVRKLEQDLTSIQNGARLDITEEPRTKIMNTFMKVTDNFLTELLEPEAEPETEPEKVINEKPLLVRVYEAYNMLTNPEQYRLDQRRKREAKKKEFLNRGIEMLRGVFDNE